ncbi:hypothetical protein G4X40_05565 [Rhodococcus sp. D2-41]|uniref:hypothetical protein n=1 Tax=Speluncibacter jeojiensis TaxID=2710754 RepID=UPI002410A6F9|nr:hypothetical protein [Rhodococcus sp. D2-41]MDG3009610.1 hypothetical protein [Rhodococcus sp. D2-41]
MGAPEFHRGLCYIHRTDPTKQVGLKSNRDSSPSGQVRIANPTPVQRAQVERFIGELRIIIRKRWGQGPRELSRRTDSLARAAGRPPNLDAILRGLGYSEDKPTADLVKREIRSISKMTPSAHIVGGGLPGLGGQR